MGQFASDSFTNSDATVLTTHSANWTRHTTYSTDCRITDANRCRASAVGYTLHYRSEVPSSADYDVSVDVYCVTFAGRDEQAGVVGRCSTSADTTYRATLKSWTTDEFRLHKVVAGVFTQLGSAYAVTLATSTTYGVKLTMSGSTVKAFLDGTERISVTDTAITDAGRAGIQVGYASASTPSNSAGFHVDNFSADQAGIGPLNLTDSVTMSDAVVRDVTKVASEMISLAEAIAKTATKPFTGALSINDSLSTLISLFLSLTNALSLSDARTVTIQKAVVESLTLSDLLAKTLTKAIADALGIADSVQTVRLIILALADAIALADSAGTTLTPGGVQAIVLTTVEKAARRGLDVALEHFPTAFTYLGFSKVGVFNKNDGVEQMLDAGYVNRRKAVMLCARDAFSSVPLKGETIAIEGTAWRIMSVDHDKVHVFLDISAPKL